MGSFALGLFLWASCGQTAAVDVWPQWRGPTGDSVTSSAALPVRWSPTENVVWKAPLPGWGTSTPAVWGDAVFVTTQDGDTLLVLRLDARTGKIVWQREAAQGTPRRKGPLGNGRFHDEHNMASPSPTTDGLHVWVHFGTGDLACYDFDGAKKWSQNLTAKFGPYSIWWGHANSPVLVGDLLVSACMQDPKGGGKSYVVAHDKLTGKEVWAVERTTGATEEPADAYTTPILHRHDGRTDLIVFGGNVLDAYEPATGKRLWSCSPFTGNRVISGPTLAGDTVYAVQGMKGPLFAVKAGGAADTTKTHVLWKYAGPTPDAASPVAVQGLVYLANNNGIAVCIDAKTGAEVWKERLADAFRATPLVAGNHIYFFAKDGKTIIIEAVRELKVVSRADLGEDVMASPAVIGPHLLLRTKEHLYRIGQ